MSDRLRLLFTSRDRRSLMLGVVAQGLQYGAAIALLPLIVTRLTVAETGIWYVFVTIQGLAALADFGFQPTVARHVATAFSGAARIETAGFSPSGGAPNLLLVALLLAVARRLYLWLALAVLVVLETAGSAYVGTLAGHASVDLKRVTFAWLVFGLATSLNLYFLWIGPFLLGAGRAAQNYLVLIASRGSFALLAAAALLLGGGLLSLSFAALAATLIGRLVGHLVLAPITTSLSSDRPSQQDRRAVLSSIWPNAHRMGLVALGAFLTTRYNVLALSSWSGLTVSASYAISLQLLAAVVQVAQLPFQIALPHFVASRVAQDNHSLRSRYVSNTIFYFVVCGLGIAVVCSLAPYLLASIGSRTSLLPTVLLVVLGIVVTLEGNHGNAGFVITTANRVPFVFASLSTGILIACLSTLTAITGWGAAGAIAVQGAVQLAYNNWRWPLYLWRDLRT